MKSWGVKGLSFLLIFVVLIVSPKVFFIFVFACYLKALEMLFHFAYVNLV